MVPKPEEIIAERLEASYHFSPAWAKEAALVILDDLASAYRLEQLPYLERLDKINTKLEKWRKTLESA